MENERKAAVPGTVGAVVGQDEDFKTRCAWCDKRSLVSPCRTCRIKHDLDTLAADEYEEYGDDPM